MHGTFPGLPLLSSYSRVSHGHQSQPSYTYAGVVTDNMHIFTDRRSPGRTPRHLWRTAPVVLPSSRQLPMPIAESRSLRTSTAQSFTMAFPSGDPFDDINVVPVPQLSNTAGSGGSGMQLVPRTQRTRVTSQSSTPTVKLPRTSSLDALVRQRTAQRVAAQDHEARLKVVAGILLNRSNNSGGRCGRRSVPPYRGDGIRTYRRSSLSTMVSVDDI